MTGKHGLRLKLTGRKQESMENNKLLDFIEHSKTLIVYRSIRDKCSPITGLTLYDILAVPTNKYTLNFESSEPYVKFDYKCNHPSISGYFEVRYDSLDYFKSYLKRILFEESVLIEDKPTVLEEIKQFLYNHGETEESILEYKRDRKKKELEDFKAKKGWAEKNLKQAEEKIAALLAELESE